MKLKLRNLTGRYSIRFKLTIILTIIIIIIIFSLWFLNRTFLADYYLQSKIDTLGKTYNEIDTTLKKNKGKTIITSDESLKIERWSEARNVSVYVLSSRLEWVYSTRQDSDSRILSIFQDYFFNGINPGVKYKEMLESTSDYEIYKIYDSNMESNYIDLLGYVGQDYIILMRTNLESMKESVTVANKFLAYVGLIAVIIATAIMYYISRKFSKPILQLAGISKKMSDLNFDVKYNVNTQDEIGELGNSINILAEKLEKTISELKSANNELLSDLQSKIEIDEMRKDFLSNVTHELKTPIALIQGYAEGLKDNINEDEESRDFYCEVIIDEAMKMNQMVKKLLSLNQIESGNNQVNIERFDIVALIQSVLNSTEILFQQKEVILHFEQREPVYVWADEYLVEEVVTNYISNALNHVDGSKIIEIKLIQQEDVVRIAVYNTGNRIPEEDIDNIWQKFYKVDKARTREYGGSGIGLSIVKAIMTSLNQKFGVINHESGVEFWFELDSRNN